MIQWLSANWPALLSVVSMVLAATIGILHLFHVDSVANSLQSIEDMIAKIQSGQK